MYVKCEEGHEVYVDCQESRCYGRGADFALCDKHQDQKLEEARDEATDAAREKVAEVMKNWECVTDIDNPLSISELAKELDAAI